MYRRFIEEVDSCAFVEFTAIKFCSLLVSSLIMAQVLAVYANDNQQLLVPKKQLAAKQAGICCFLVDSKFSWFLWSCFLQHSSTSERSKPGWPSFWKYSKALENKWSWGCGNRYLMVSSSFLSLPCSVSILFSSLVLPFWNDIPAKEWTRLYASGAWRMWTAWWWKHALYWSHFRPKWNHWMSD